MKINQLMLHSKIIADCSEMHTKQINTLCVQNLDLWMLSLVVHIGNITLFQKVNHFEKPFHSPSKCTDFGYKLFFRHVFRSHKCLASYVTVGHAEALDVSTSCPSLYAVITKIWMTPKFVYKNSQHQISF